MPSHPNPPRPAYACSGLKCGGLGQQPIDSQVETHEFTEKSGVTTMRITDVYATKEALGNAVSSGASEGTEDCYKHIDEMLAQRA